MQKDRFQRDVQEGYDRVAERYATQFRDEMAKKPFDCKMLDWLVEKVDGAGVICDMGCGPGQIVRYIHERGAESCGIDLSPEMVKQAQRLHPEISFQQGNMLALTDVEDNSFAGISAFYSIIHIPRESVVVALQELKRVLRPQGKILLTFHIGQEVIQLDEWWGNEVSIDFTFFETAEFKQYLQQAGFIIEEAIERDLYPDVEVQHRRAYIFARKP